MINNKRGEDGAWTIRKVVTLILLIVLLILIVVGLYSGKLVPLMKLVEGNFNGILVRLGIIDSGAVLSDYCFQEEVGIGTGERREDVTFVNCLTRRRIVSCNLSGFSDGSVYYYSPNTGQLNVKRKDSGVYLVDTKDFENVGKDYKLGDVPVDEIWYNGVVYLYSVFGIDKETAGRRSEYDIYSYLKTGMYKSMGGFPDMFIIYGTEYKVYLMEANGRYLVFNEDTFKTGGLGWWDRNWWGFEASVLDEKHVTPIIGAFENKPDWALYYGNDMDEALKKWRDASVGITGFDDDDDVRYASCRVLFSNSLYQNCYNFLKEDERLIARGGIDVLLNEISKKYNLEYEGGDVNEFDSGEEVLIRRYLEERLKATQVGLIKSESEAVNELNKMFKEKGDVITIRGHKFNVSASQNTKGNLPLVVIMSEDGSREYWLRFNGNELYYNGETEFFVGGGNEIMAPFKVVDKSTKKAVKVSRTFSESDDELMRNKEVYDFMREYCQ